MKSISAIRRAIATLRRLHQRTARADLGMIAGAVAFFGFLAIFPAFAAVITIWGYAGDPSAIRGEIGLLADILPADAFLMLSGQVEALLAATGRQLGWATILATLLALWSARSGVAALVHGINTIHHQPDRSGLGSLAVSVVLTLVLVGITLASLLASVVAPVVIAHLPLGTAASVALEVANNTLGLALVVSGLALTYRFGPNRPAGARAPLLTPGLLVALALWAVASRGFVLYLANFNSYNQIYGSIGAVVAFLMWLYLGAYAVLLGAAVDADRDAPEPTETPQ